MCGGRDRIWGRAGADRILARGGGRDRVSCGDGNDNATLDTQDRRKDCEN